MVRDLLTSLESKLNELVATKSANLILDWIAVRGYRRDRIGTKNGKAVDLLKEKAREVLRNSQGRRYFGRKYYINKVEVWSIPDNEEGLIILRKVEKLVGKENVRKHLVLRVITTKKSSVTITGSIQKALAEKAAVTNLLDVPKSWSKASLILGRDRVRRLGKAETKITIAWSFDLQPEFQTLVQEMGLELEIVKILGNTPRISFGEIPRKYEQMRGSGVCKDIIL